MRRLLLPAALLAAVAAVLWLSTAGGGRAEPKRGAHAAQDGAASARPGEAVAAEGAEEAASTAATALPTLVRGVVTGPLGVLWCARVVAYRMDAETVMAEAWTDPEGRYSLPVEPGVEFVLAVEPVEETGFTRVRRAGLLLAEGDERVEDVAVVEGACLRGQVVDARGSGVRHVELLALRAQDADAADLPGTLAAKAHAKARSGSGGRFRLKGLAAGAYVLVLNDPGWMFPSAVTARTDGPDLSLVAVPALTLDLVVRDIETDAPLPAFTVRARTPDRVLLEAAGADGAFVRRMPFPGPPGPVQLEISAPGFAPVERPNSPARGQTEWLVPVRDPNTTVRISFGRDDPYLGEISATYRTRAHAGYGHVRFERVEDGVFRAALPHGLWDLSFVLPTYFGEDRVEAEARVRGGAETEIPLALPAGGTLLLSPAPGAERCTAWIRTTEDGVRRRWGKSFHVPREGTRVQGIPPGAYEVMHDRMGRDEQEWLKEVQVGAGTVEQITMPE